MSSKWIVLDNGTANEILSCNTDKQIEEAKERMRQLGVHRVTVYQGLPPNHEISGLELTTSLCSVYEVD